jgi:uncharacterized membrane protein YeaQ/YmgE (transglycosylase-associated protein family)
MLATLGYGTVAVLGYFRSDSTSLRYIALYPATAGFFSAITLIITWTLNNQDTQSKKGTGMAVLNIIGQIGPLVGTSIFPEEDGPWYVKGMSICAAFMLLVGVLAAALRMILVRANKKAKRESRGGQYAGVPPEEGTKARAERARFEYML